ncbi:preprotein translocase subunit SecE [compost metagenome]|jgi:preprotein translocase subunit SecE|uniref:Protein translocase subunit SecE n=1 Tax=Clostridium intestinale DSM 6191 TaxID=1121320 RepID=A0A1M6FE19_9CLOT|nr:MULTISPECIES: preprotein translocase subunit SecE [Clostridium]WRY50184.1 preprotein translocase subunit SecE [Clostridium intestinale]SHI95899.1 preprotein translocase subunit SecE [Clostridium intestinale DSM 6191]
MAVNGKVKKESAPKREAGIVKFFREVKGEVNRITWPNKNEAKKALIATIAFTLAYVVLVGGLDLVFKNLFEIILKLK